MSDLTSDTGAARPGTLIFGIDAIRGALKTLPSSPGVYRMLDRKGDAVYVGKARNLKARVQHYTNLGNLSTRLKRMVAETTTLEVVVTHTEVEALLLENNLIKKLMPRYNVLLRDDKSFPYIHVTSSHEFPQLAKYRGARGEPGEFFGPFASAGAVKRTLIALQRAFLLRSCSDSVFETRTRPCLLYQIKRCSAPCVGRIDREAYGRLVEDARNFLRGRSSDVQQRLAEQMQQLSLEEVLAGFLGQFYETKPPPRLVLLNHEPADAELLAQALAVKVGARVQLLVPQRGDKRNIVDHALVNAREALARRMAESASQQRLLEEVAELFGLEGPPQRIEVYDNSHIQGAHSVGAMIVAGPEGFIKNAYRKFNIRGTTPARDEANAAITPGDDYGMMREVLTRRFGRALKEDPARESGSWPDLVLIDGGEGQLAVVQQVLADLGIADVPLVAIAKGPDRDAGRERFFLPDKPPRGLDPKSPVLYYLQRLRDEAHRFAIGTHRARHIKVLGTSRLDEVPGIGAKRKKALLHHFGSARGVARAGLTDLAQVDGISETVAKKIYDHFHTDG